MTDHMDIYPPDMEPADDSSPQMARFGEVIEELHEELQGTQYERSQEELFYDMLSFAKYWIAQGDMTGATWDVQGDGIAIRKGMNSSGEVWIGKEEMNEVGAEPGDTVAIMVSTPESDAKVETEVELKSWETVVSLHYDERKELGVGAASEVFINIVKVSD